MSYSIVPPFEEYRGQLVQYCTQNALVYPQRSGLVTTTTATSCSQHCKGGAVVTHQDAIAITVMLTLVDMVSLTLQRVFAQG